ncbi:unnamed protein product [Brassica rapa]|uniref:F-box domain-containing protein n=2 Tax=Brassica campestris TaxID=3711 RepID=A0A8D9HM95_BRACM|nr:unnamed protein product [Brassica rapa]
MCSASPSSLFPEDLTVKPIVQALPAPSNINIPSDLLREILSRLGLKANIHASLVCKTWFQVAVSVRKLQPHPWIFYPLKGEANGDYILLDRQRSQAYKLNFPDLKGHGFSCSRDGWLLVSTNFPSYLVFFFNPFTREYIYLPEAAPTSGYCLTFTAAPTSSSCLVISLNDRSICSYIEIATWRPGETLWTTHRFENLLPGRRWKSCVFSNGVLYCLTTFSNIGIFDPSRATWNILPVEPCPAFFQVDLGRRVLLTEHEGDIFVILTSRNKNPLMFKLNLKRNAWEEKGELGGLTVFAGHPTSLTRAGLSVEERNKIYPSHNGHLGVYYSLGDGIISSRFPSSNYLSNRIAWVDPPHNNFNL